MLLYSCLLYLHEVINNVPQGTDIGTLSYGMIGHVVTHDPGCFDLIGPSWFPFPRQVEAWEFSCMY